MFLPIAAFLFTFALVLACGGFAAAYLRTKENRRLRAMFQTTDAGAMEHHVRLLRPRPRESQIAEALRSLGVGTRINLILLHSGLNWDATKWLAFTLGFLVGAALLASFAPPSPARFWLIAGAAALGSSIPTIIVLRARSKRLDKFTEQFPEALDFVSRSLRAGHAFSIGLEMLVADSPEPLAGIFRHVLNDIHLGASQDEAFAKLTMLVPLVDVRFFTAAVLLQQETGGNLSEILSKLAYIIRERFRLKGQVKAVSAHGRITAFVLLIMPIVVGLLLYLTSPDYLNVLFTNRIGRIMLGGSIAGQVVGYFFIRKIVDIKV